MRRNKSESILCALPENERQHENNGKNWQPRSSSIGRTNTSFVKCAIQKFIIGHIALPKASSTWIRTFHNCRPAGTRNGASINAGWPIICTLIETALFLNNAQTTWRITSAYVGPCIHSLVASIIAADVIAAPFCALVTAIDRRFSGFAGRNPGKQEGKQEKNYANFLHEWWKHGKQVCQVVPVFLKHFLFDFFQVIEGSLAFLLRLS